MMLKLKMVFAISLVFVTQVLIGQTTKEAFEKVNKTFASATNISYNIKYLYYANNTDKQPVETMTGAYKRIGDSYYSRIETKELVVNEKYRLVIDNETQHLIIENRQRVSFKQDEQMGVNLDSALSLCSKITSRNEQGKQVYSMFFSDEIPIYTQIDVSIDSKTNFIQKISIFFKGESERETPRLDVELSAYNTNPQISKDFFSEKKYVSIDSGGNVTLNINYRLFKLLSPKVSTQ